MNLFEVGETFSVVFFQYKIVAKNLSCFFFFFFFCHRMWYQESGNKYLLKEPLEIHWGLKFKSKSIGAMYCGIDCSRSGTNMPDLDPFQIWNFSRTDDSIIDSVVPEIASLNWRKYYQIVFFSTRNLSMEVGCPRIRCSSALSLFHYSWH